MKQKLYCIQNANSMKDAAILGCCEIMKETKHEGKANIVFHSLATSNGYEASLENLKVHQKVSKIPGVYEMNKKIVIAKSFNLSATFDQQLASLISSFWPRTFTLPEQYSEISAILLLNKKKHAKKRITLIAKPDGGSQGEGITLLQSDSDLRAMSSMGYSTTRRAVVQHYVKHPFLLKSTKCKFDLRLYALIAAVDPLRVYIHREGLARFCTQDYETPTEKNLHDAFRHLTNYSLNKRSEDFIHSSDEENMDSGSKRALSSVFQQLREESETGSDSDDPFFDEETFWEKTTTLIKLTCLGMQPGLKHSVRKVQTSGCNLMSGGCFQILGVDVLMDRNGSPWLLETNANPSMRLDFELYDSKTGNSSSVNSAVDEHVKGTVMGDFMRLVTSGEVDDEIIEVDCEEGKDCEIFKLLVEVEKIYSVLTKKATRLTLTKSRFLANTLMKIQPPQDVSYSSATVDLLHQKWNLSVSAAVYGDLEQHQIVELQLFPEFLISIMSLDKQFKDGGGGGGGGGARRWR